MQGRPGSLLLSKGLAGAGDMLFCAALFLRWGQPQRNRQAAGRPVVVIIPTAVCRACRMYAAAAARSDGLLLLSGGRDTSGVPLGDAFGLARHRDGRWEWAAAPGSMPAPR